ncbi:MAG: L-aspartate oxidase [Gammaproteobacteria bacterium]
MAAAHSPGVLVIGGGLAGLTVALRLAEQDIQVTLLAKRQLTEGSSAQAQGGIAAVLTEGDSVDSHVADTLAAGGGLCHRETVEYVVNSGPDCVDWLVELGVQFTREDDGEAFHLTREGGHTHRRVIHATDATGWAVVQTLEARVRKHPNIKILEQYLAVDIITSLKLGLPGENRALGVYALDKHSGHVEALTADKLVLATGGASKVYLYTSNPDTSTGDGIAMAWRAGCRVANMEFVQFHPTCLYHPQAKSFLISEAVRGEGGRLVLEDGTRFMEDYDERGELASRDIVARAIDAEMKRGGYSNVYLDIRHKPARFIEGHFPNITKRCAELGIDIARQRIPVVPAAHYTCGGVLTDLQGMTDIDGLYVVGESASTGLHGANRLASNSLLECLVFAMSAATHIGGGVKGDLPERPDVPAWDESQVSDPDEQIVVAHNWDELRRAMWDYVGIVRTTKRLERARHRVDMLTEEIREYYSNFRIDNNLIELRNLVQVAELIIDCSLLRKESRGLHYTRDYPEPSSAANPEDTILEPENFSV